MKLVEWNIHKMTNNIPVQQFVIDTITEIDADLICLLEYLTDKGIESALEKDYWFEESHSVSGNKVFIAVKKEIAPCGIVVVKKDEVLDCYNFLHIDFKNNEGDELSVIGVRMLSPINAKKQTSPLVKYLKNLDNTYICAGDFNIKDYRMNIWFPDIEIEKHIVTEEILSDTSYIYVDKYKVVIGYGAVDHILHSDNIEVMSKYHWNFTKLDSCYPRIETVKPNTIWDINAAYPDHAIMEVELTKRI